MNIAHKLNVSLMFWMNLCVECMFIRPRSEKINENFKLSILSQEDQQFINILLFGAG